MKSKILPATGIFTVAAGLVTAGIWAHGVYTKQEQSIAHYCSETQTGEAIERAWERATARDLSVTEYRVDQGRTAALSVSAKTKIWPGPSTCFLSHDGETISAVAYNPWYH